MNSSELKGFLTGLMFGDGYIDNGITKRAFRIKSINKDFIDNIYNELTSCTNFNVFVREHPEKYSHGCMHKKYWELHIKAHPYFVKKYHHFYDDQRKRVVSKEALSWITPYGLANWYMSDGYVCHVGKESGKIYNRRIEFSTDRYSYQTINNMAQMLKERFGLDVSVIKRGKCHRIRIKQTSYESFINIIYPYIVDSMKYKVYLAYEKQPIWMTDEMWTLQQSLCSAISLTDKAEGKDIV